MTQTTASPYRRRRSRHFFAAALLALICAGAATAATIQSGDLRITVLAQVKPYKLPRTGTAPIAVFVAGHLQNAKGGIPPQLQRMTIRVNKHGLLQSKGLPVCQIHKIQPASDERALENCGDAVIGSGQFWANIVLPDQGAYRTQGRLLIFNGREKGRPVILAHIYTTHPFSSSFVIPFSVHHIAGGAACHNQSERRRTKRGKDAGSEGRGAHSYVRDPTRATEDAAQRCVRRRSPYGTELKASLPQALGSWGYLDRIKLTLKRKYAYRGKQLSYFNSGCPAPKGAKRASFPLAYAEFFFKGRPAMGASVNKSCGVLNG